MLDVLKNFYTVVDESGITAYLIILMGLVSLTIMIERTRALFLIYDVNVTDFMNHVKALIHNDQIEEAITSCAGKEEIPLVAVVKRILERSDRDDESIEKGQEIAIAEIMPQIGKRLNYLSMVANVVTLLKLLGTIQGLIMAFSAVSQADPAQKQTILSNGISMAMYTTAFGLIVAIPTMIVYSILHTKQNRHFEEIIANSSKVVDWLSTRHYQPFHISNVYPNETVSAPLPNKPNKAPPKAKPGAA